MTVPDPFPLVVMLIVYNVPCPSCPSLLAQEVVTVQHVANQSARNTGVNPHSYHHQYPWALVCALFTYMGPLF